MPSSSNHFSLNSSSYIPILSQKEVSKASRYGFNGKMKDKEVEGEGDVYDFGARMLDARLGRWLSVDPLAKVYVSQSPYSFVANSPIMFKDGDGREIVDPKTGQTVVKVDGAWKTVSGHGSDGKPIYGEVSKEFVKNSQPVLDKLTATQTGTKIYDKLQAISTKVTIDLSDKDNKEALKEKGSNSEWHATMDEAKNLDGLYKAVTITPNMDAIDKKAKATGVNPEEKFLQVLSVEEGHIGTKEQVEKEKGFEDKTATPDEFAKVYNGLLNQAIRVGKEYRKEKGIAVDESSKIPITGPQKSDKGSKLTLDKDNQ